MLRRDFLKAAILSPIFPLRGSSTKDYGWLPPSLPSFEPSFLELFPQLKNTGKGKVVLLYKYIEAIIKKSLPAHRQRGGDCTSQAGGLGTDILQAIQVLLKRDKWIGKVATEVLHVGGRQIIGKRNSGGVAIGEFVTFITKYGTVFRKNYSDGKETYDFSKYTYDNCRQLSNFPDWLLKECKKHQIIKAIKITSWNEARDAIRNLCPIIIGSKIGFDNVKRDKDGFTKPSGIWSHAWLLFAIDDRFKRPGGCLMNSHGDTWVKGPRRHNQPRGSIWVDKETIHKMISQYNDSYALCRLSGLEPTKYKLW